MRNKKTFISIFTVICIILSSVSAAAINITSYGACIMDFESGEVLFEKDGGTARVPASMTKIMTLYLIFERLADGRLAKNSAVPVSAAAARFSRERGTSNIPLTHGDFYSVEELINAIAVPSACAACTAIAEYISGSEEEFVRLMNAKVTEMGLTAYFADSCGLSDYNLISPVSLASLVRSFISNYPDILNYTKKSAVYIRGKKYKSTNELLLADNKNYYPASDGFKTGTTSAAGKCIAATAVRGDTRIITVTMHSASNNERFSDTAKMLNAGFEEMTRRTSNIVSTDIRAFINSAEIPCYYYLGRKPCLAVIAEDLNSCGFETVYSPEENMLYIYYTGGAAAPLLLPADKTPGTPVFPIFKNSGLRATVINGESRTELETVLSLNGRCCISADELGGIFQYTWDDASREAHITTVE